MDIRIFGDPVLRTPAIEVVDFDKELRQLVKDLTDTMVNAPGAGLAAPQIGVGLRVFTYHVDDELGHLINPSLDLSSEMQEGEEGCLSFPGIFVTHPVRYGWWPRASTSMASRSCVRDRNCWPAASSTRATTSTASCSSTAWTRPIASWP